MTGMNIRKNVAWIKFSLSNQKKKHLALIATGVARSYTGNGAFKIIDLDSMTCLKIDPEKNYSEIIRIQDINTGKHLHTLRDMITGSPEMCFLMTEKNNLPEKLTEHSGWNIICIYVTLTRSKFENVQTDENVKKCLVKIKAAFDDKPEIITKWWG